MSLETLFYSLFILLRCGSQEPASAHSYFHLDISIICRSSFRFPPSLVSEAVLTYSSLFFLLSFSSQDQSRLHSHHSFDVESVPDAACRAKSVKTRTSPCAGLLWPGLKPEPGSLCAASAGGLGPQQSMGNLRTLGPSGASGKQCSSVFREQTEALRKLARPSVYELEDDFQIWPFLRIFKWVCSCG